MRGRGEDDPLIFGGSASPALTAAICERLDVAAGRGETVRFPDGNLGVRVLENVRGRETYVVQSIAFEPNRALVELLFWADALRRASAASVTAVIPYFGYAKGDKKDEPRVSIRARVVADALQVSGVDHVVTMDLHAPQVQGFFGVPVDEIEALPLLSAAIEGEGRKELVVVSPDVGFTKRARNYAARLRAPLAVAEKRRLGVTGEEVEVIDLLGEVKGRDAVLVDDFTLTMSTLAEVASRLESLGARSVLAAASHGLFATGSMQRLERSPIEALFVTDTVEARPVELSSKVRVLGSAGLFAEAISRLQRRRSLRGLFESGRPGPAPVGRRRPGVEPW